MRDAVGVWRVRTNAPPTPVESRHGAKRNSAVFTEVSDPTSCSLTQSINGWSATAAASFSLSDTYAAGYDSYGLATSAGAYGEDGMVEGTASISGVFAASYALGRCHGRRWWIQ